MSHRMAAISSASVHEVVISAFLKPYCSSKKFWHFLVYTPLPDSLPE